MKKTDVISALILAALLAGVWPSGSSAGLVGLSRNPFSRPPPKSLNDAGNRSGNKAAKPSRGVPALRVTATLVSDDNPMAMVNGKLIGIGERIRGARLVKVEEGAAWFEYRGRRLKYRIRPRLRPGKSSPL
jgi:hypothetical protein